MDALIGAAAGLLATPLVWLGIGHTSKRPWSHRRTWLIAVVVACTAAGGWAGAWASTPQVPAAWWLLLVTGVALGVVDAREHRLPDRLVAAAGLGVLIALAVAAAGGRGWSNWWMAAAAAAGAFVVMYALAMATGIGYGDVKLAAVIAGCAGFGSPTAAATTLIVGFVMAGLAGLIQLARGVSLQQSIALGPWLLIGSAASLPAFLP